MNIEDSFLVHLLLNALPDDYGHLKTLYNTQKQNWSINELISFCVQVEDELIKKGKAVDINYMSKPKFKKFFGNKKFQGSAGASSSKTPVKSDGNKNKQFKPQGPVKCFFCKKSGHFKKDCEGFKNWLNKKGTVLSKSVFVLESNPSMLDNSFWFDTGSPIHIINSIQGLSRIRIPSKNETRVCAANGQRVAVQAVGSLKLVFKNKFVLELDNVYCIPSIKRNLISGS